MQLVRMPSAVVPLAALLALAAAPAAATSDARQLAAYSAALDLDDAYTMYYGTFPPDFWWASATSAYQIEGAWDEDGKGESIWDRRVHSPNNIESGHTGDVACDSYHRYQEDVSLLRDLGVSHYRFSIAWTRIQPTGQEQVANAAGVDYYNRLIDALLAADIQPMVTLYHWDLPQALEDEGGWLNDTLIVPAFAHYARLCYQAFGDRAKLWITHNEPWIVAWLGYGTGAFAPGVYGPGDKVYVAAHNLIKAHAEAYHVYKDEFKALQQGEVGITLNTGWSEPRDKTSASDVRAGMRAMEFDLGWFAHPIFVDGSYPPVMKWNVWEKSMAQGFNESRLPEFTAEESARIVGTSDFFGLNHYTSGLTFDETRDLFPPSYETDKNTGGASDPSWPTSGSDWLLVAPFGMRKLLNYIKDFYGNPRVVITENGMSDRNSSIQDDHRVFYYRWYINNVLKAIDLDGCNVIGYTAWSLLDNFEWNTGYNEKFGLHYVDFSDQNRTRTVKDSANFYKQIISDEGFPATGTTEAPGDPSPDGGASPHGACVVALTLLAIIITRFN